MEKYITMNGTANDSETPDASGSQLMQEAISEMANDLDERDIFAKLRPPHTGPDSDLPHIRQVVNIQREAGLAQFHSQVDGAMSPVFQVPNVCRMVIYNSYGTPGGEYKPEPRAAVVTGVTDPTDPNTAVSLCVLNPTGLFFNTGVKYGPGQPGCWEWPQPIKLAPHK